MKNIIRTATRGMVEEFRDMNVGDVVQFPVEKYNYNSLRTLPSTCLVEDRMNGKHWKTRMNYADKCVDVTRTA